MKNLMFMDSTDGEMISSFSMRKGKATTLNGASSSPLILNFANANSLENRWPLISPADQASDQVLKHDQSSKIRSEKYDHVVAERKRREHISQQFVTLSGLVPGLKKMDKTSVLVDTIKYLKDLQERLKSLEDRRTKHTMESVVLVRKSQIIVKKDQGFSLDEKSSGFDEQLLPEIEAKICNNSVFIKIHCEKHKGVLAEILSNVEKHNLLVVNINVSPLGNLAFCVTITAEMKKEFNSTMQNIVEDLRSCMVRKE